MKYTISLIYGFVLTFSFIITSCKKEEKNNAFQNEGKVLLSEKEDFKDFPQANHIFIDLDLSKEEVDNYSHPRQIHIYPDSKIIRKLFTHSPYSIQFSGGFHSEKMHVSEIRENKVTPQFIQTINPVLKKNSLPEIRKSDIKIYWYGRYSIATTDDFWYDIDCLILKDNSSFILFTKIPKEVIK